MEGTFLKHKKVFAILTLMCFLFTLVPMTAFAADEFEEGQVYIYSDGSYDEHANVMVHDDFTVFMGIDNNTVTSSGYSFIIVDEDGIGVAASNSNRFELDEPGNYKIYALNHAWGSENQITKYINSIARKSEIVETLMDVFEDELEDIGYASIKVKSAKEYAITLSSSGSGLQATTAGDENAKNGYEYVLSGVAANNGFDAETITATVSYVDNDGDEHKVKDATLNYRTNSSYITVEKLDEETNRRGQAEFQIHATKDGDFKVTVSYAGTSVDILVQVSNTTEKTIETISVPKAPVALDTAVDGYSGIEFELRDKNGSIVKTASATPKVVVVSAPEDSDLQDETLTLKNDGDTWILSAEDGVTFDAEGMYTFKAYLKNGASATASVTIKEFGDPVSMKLTYSSKNVAPGASVKVKNTQLVDANGVTKKVADTNYNVVYAATGVAVGNVDAKGTVTAKDTTQLREEKLIGATIQVLAICEELNLTANAEIKVVEEAAMLKFASKDAELAVNNTIKINTVNEKGESVTVTNLSSAKAIVLNAPEHAVYAADTTVNAKKGTITLTFTASVAGEYTLQIIAITSDHRNLSGTETITVGAEEGAFQDVVVLSIGSTTMIKNGEVCTLPTAAKIENGRTMVPFRATLEAFGATVDWDATTRTASAELNGIKVVMTIDTTTYSISGVTHTADMAPYIDNGSTMVPLVFFTNAFGIHATVITAEDGSVSDVLFAK